jgi:hypothetical protein
MAGFRNLRVMAEAEENGQIHLAYFRKPMSQATSTGTWFDTSMSPGRPPPNYYIGTPLVFTPMTQSGNKGLDLGNPMAGTGYKKFLRRVTVQCNLAAAVPMQMKILDYLGFYGFVDMSTLDEDQVMDNTLSLTRYETGEGVMMMPIIVAPCTAAALAFVTITYTNSEGVSGRTATFQMGALFSGSLSVGNAISFDNFWFSFTAQSTGPFVTLQAGDLGVRSIQTVNVTAPGDTGLVAFVLVKVLGNMTLLETTAASEKDFFVNSASMPEILDDAFVSLYIAPNGTLVNAQLFGTIETTWG